MYLVKSRSRLHIPPFRVDVATHECRCEKALMGSGAKFRSKNGYLPYKMFCHHLRDAIAYDGMLLREMVEERNLAK